MPNREGGYGGYRQDPNEREGRKVHTPGTGGVRRMARTPRKERIITPRTRPGRTAKEPARPATTPTV